MERFFLVRGRSGFVCSWSHAVVHMYEDDPDYEILGRDLTKEESIAMARVFNANIRQQLGETK